VSSVISEYNLGVARFELMVEENDYAEPILKSEQHHWWPKTLSKHWANEDGMLTRVSTDGAEVTQAPAKFGSIRNGHHAKFGGPWTRSYESIFQTVDNSITSAIAEINDKIFSREQEMHFDVLPDLFKTIGAIIASLAVRSPRHRFISKETVNYYRDGLEEIADKNPIIAYTVARDFKHMAEALVSAGIIIILKANKDGDEFVFGDGFYSNLNFTSSPQLTVKALCPVTPNTALIFYRGSSPYRKTIKVVELISSDVDQVNFLTQIYSGKYLFYRNRKPLLIDQYFNGIFSKLIDHRSPFVEKLVEPFECRDNLSAIRAILRCSPASS
jgi:hypothetical protein